MWLSQTMSIAILISPQFPHYVASNMTSSVVSFEEVASDLHACWHLNTFRMYRNICKMLDIGVPMDSEMLGKHLKKIALKLCTAELIFLDNMAIVATGTFIWFRCDTAWIKIVIVYTSAHPNISGARPTNGISIEFEKWSKFAVLLFKMCSTDHNGILHTSRHCYCGDICKNSLSSYFINKSITKFHWISNSIEISLVRRAPGQATYIRTDNICHH